MNKLIEKILTEWSYRVHDGMPNVKNPLHLVHLEETLNELRLPRKVSEKLLQNLRQIKEDDIVKNKKSGNTYVVKKHNTNTQDLITKDASDDEIKKVKQDKEDEETTEEVDETSKEITQNRSNIFEKKITGAGGGETALQEEITGISRQIAQEYPDDSPEEHKRKVRDYIKKHYGDTHYGKDETLMNKLIKKSVSGLESMKKIKANKAMKYKDDQPPGYPINLTFTKDGTASAENLLKEKLEDAKRRGDTEAVAHYERELEYFDKHATKRTGKEGDGDTAIIYEDTDGRIRIVYISNKQTLSDPHSNATVKSAAKSIMDNREEGANAEALAHRLDESVGEGIRANKNYTIKNRKIIDENREELNKAPLTKIATKALTGRAEYDEETRHYIDKCKKSDAVKKCIESKEGYDINNDDHVVECAFDVAGNPDNQGVGSSKKQAANKLMLKITRTTASVREKLKKCMGGDESKLGECAKKVSAAKSPDGKPLFGGNLSSEDMISIYNNKVLEKLERVSKERDEAIAQAHEDMHNAVVELDVTLYMAQGMTQEEALEKYKNEAGPNEITYTKSFMERMHWDRYIDGVDDDKKLIEVGDRSYSPKDFRNCIAKLTGFKGDTSTPEGKKALKEHIHKNMRVQPDTMSLSFVNKEGKEVHIGEDTWRNAGDTSKIAGGLGKDMIKCLESTE